MRNILTAALLLGCTALFAQKPAQKTPQKPDTSDGKHYAQSSRSLKIDASVTTSHEVTIRGQRVPYKVTAGSLPVWDEEGKTIAGVFYTYFDIEIRTQ